MPMATSNPFDQKPQIWKTDFRIVKLCQYIEIVVHPRYGSVKHTHLNRSPWN
jgi:hypothetical protein